MTEVHEYIKRPPCQRGVVYLSAADNCLAPKTG